MRVIDEESFLAENGASSFNFGDPALHEPGLGMRNRNSAQKLLDEQARKDERLGVKREELRKEYKRLCEAGEIRPPSNRERLIKTANGHPDNESVQAARRICERRGIQWQ